VIDVKMRLELSGDSLLAYRGGVKENFLWGGEGGREGGKEEG